MRSASGASVVGDGERACFCDWFKVIDGMLSLVSGSSVTAGEGDRDGMSQCRRV